MMELMIAMTKAGLGMMKRAVGRRIIVCGKRKAIVSKGFRACTSGPGMERRITINGYEGGGGIDGG